ASTTLSETDHEEHQDQTTYRRNIVKKNKQLKLPLAPTERIELQTDIEANRLVKEAQQHPVKAVEQMSADIKTADDGSRKANWARGAAGYAAATVMLEDQ